MTDQKWSPWLLAFPPTPAWVFSLPDPIKIYGETLEQITEIRLQSRFKRLRCPQPRSPNCNLINIPEIFVVSDRSKDIPLISGYP